MIKTKFFRHDNLGDIEDAINNFLESRKIAPNDIIKIYYNAVVQSENVILNTVILVYKVMSEEEKQSMQLMIDANNRAIENYMKPSIAWSKISENNTKLPLWSDATTEAGKEVLSSKIGQQPAETNLTTILLDKIIELLNTIIEKDNIISALRKQYDDSN